MPDLITYEPECRATTIRMSSEVELQAGYGSDGRLAWRTEPSNAQAYFLYDGDTPVVQLSGSTGVVNVVNTFDANGLLSRNSQNFAGGTERFYAFDPQGDTAEMISGSGSTMTLLESAMYDAYGNLLSGTASQTDPYGFGAQWGYFTDYTTGVSLAGHRYYDPAAGRWLNRDPAGYGGGLDLYGYTGDDPENASDGDGLGAGGAAGQWDTIGGYFGEVGHVFQGYADIFSPTAIRDSASSLGEIDGTCGGGAAADAAGMGLVHTLIDWFTTDNSRTFGNSFGSDLRLAAGGAARFAEGRILPPRLPDDTPASLPVGRRGSPMNVPRGTNAPGSVNGIAYKGHAFDQMQGRGIMPSMVE